MSFKFLHPSIQNILQDLGLTPTPGQKEYLKGIISKQDLLVVASTGSGKTFGTIIACLNRIIIEKPQPISTIVITPLKALNRDIFRRVLPELGDKLDISIAVRHGDTPPSERQKQTKNPPQILITTPELFQAMLPAKILGREILKNVQTVVIDEIHELISTKRGVQLSLALERLKARTKKDFQRIGLSATIGNPDKVMKFLAPKSNNYQIVNIPPSKKLILKVVYPKDVPPYLKDLVKKLHTTDEAASRFFCLLDIIKAELGTVLVFTNTRQQAEILGYRLNRYNENVSPEDQISFEVHHSSLSTQSRLKAEQEVRGGKLDVIIATSSLELGIDIGAINLVVQYMSPRRIETLIQRVGRAGHGLERESKGIIIAENPRDLVESFFIKKLTSEGKVEPTHVHKLSWDILFHQIIGILIDLGETSVRKILRIINSSFLYQNITSKDLLPLLEYGKNNYFFYINKDEENGRISLKVKRKAYRYYYSNLSTIPTKKTYSIVDIGTQARVGHLDDAFVSTRGEKGAIFILNGLPWELLATKENKIEVRQVKGITQATLPTWEGELIPVSYMVSQSTLELFGKRLDIGSESKVIREELIEFRDKQLKMGSKPSSLRLVVEQAGRQFVIHTFLGSKGNETFGLLLSSIIGAKQGHSIQYKADPYSIFFSCFRPIDIKETLSTLEREHIIPLLAHRIKTSELFAWRLR
ncbi:MAG: DEAD/DEAH box helicase, partial [Candidatus Hodarchaeales archaeon]